LVFVPQGDEFRVDIAKICGGVRGAPAAHHHYHRSHASHGLHGDGVIQVSAHPRARAAKMDYGAMLANVLAPDNAQRAAAEAAVAALKAVPDNLPRVLAHVRLATVYSKPALPPHLPPR
jgi:hypothetical protein